MELVLPVYHFEHTKQHEAQTESQWIRDEHAFQEFALDECHWHICWPIKLGSLCKSSNQNDGEQTYWNSDEAAKRKIFCDVADDSYNVRRIHNVLFVVV